MVIHDFSKVDPGVRFPLPAQEWKFHTLKFSNCALIEQFFIDSGMGCRKASLVGSSMIIITTIMFSFFQTIFHGVKIAIATATIAIGLISATAPQAPAIVNTNNTFTIDHQKAEISKTIQQVQPTKKVKTIIKTVDNSAELEKAKQEVETQRVDKEQTEAKLKEIQDQQAAQAATQAQTQPNMV